MSRTASDEGVVAPANVHLANGEHAHGTREGSCRKSDPPGLRRVPEEWRRLRRCLEAAAKGFAIGAGLKGGLALFSVLVRLKSRISLKSSARKAGVFTNKEAVVVALEETLRYGIFLGTLAGTYVSVDEVIAAMGGHRR
ncbi:hypothetical protein B296_00038076 [Ensete ventricosum]|uniref:Uncharacterized protein n=1 Tax=Ensete ventricosum TaxID=4639 RepID=A0A426Y479_ENSVE|nr:hypothetical protein B296_00038076 [Ensete ventricosum]